MGTELSEYLVLALATVVAGVLAITLFELGKTFLDGASVVNRRASRRDRVAIASVSKNRTMLGMASFAGSSAVVVGWLMLIGPRFVQALHS